jgi:PAS domain S-box-containing protein
MQERQNPEDTTRGKTGVEGWFAEPTGRERADKTLRKERDFISAVLDTAGALVVVLDREGRIVRFNRACERTTGYSSGEVTGKLLWDLFLIPEEVEQVKAVFEKLQAGLFPSEYENHWVTKNGERRLIAWSNTALMDANGAVEHVIGTGIDVTERRRAESQRDATLEALKKAHEDLELRVVQRTIELQNANESLRKEIAERRRVEEALRESESHMRSLMENAESYAIFRLAVDPTYPYGLRIVVASPSLKELLGISDLSDVSTWIGNIHPDDLARVVEANSRSLETGVLFDEQYRVFKPARREWDWVHNRSMPVFDAAGTLTHYNGLMVDITKQKRAEEGIRRQNEFLAALHETALGVVGRLDVADLLETVMERALSLFSATYGFIYLVRPEDDELEIYIGTGPSRAYIGQRVKRGEGLAGRVCASGQPMVVEDYHTWSGRSPQFEGHPFGPALGAPLMSGAEVVGVLGVARAVSAPPFRKHEIDLIRRFSHVASIALDNARLYTSLQQGLALEELVGRISAHFINLGPSEIDAGIQYALQAIGEFSGIDRSYVFQFSGDGTALDNTHEWCAEGIEPFADSLKGMPRAAFPWFLERLERFEIISLSRVGDMPPEARAERSECEREGIQSIVIAPLAYRGMLVGFLGFDSVRAERVWTEETATLLTIVGGLIVNALEHKRAQAIQAGQRQFLELLATGGTFSETLHMLLRLIEQQWPGMLGLILLLDEDGKHLHIGAAVSLPEDYVQSIEGLEIGPMVGSCGTACYRRERVIVEDTATDPRWAGLRDLALQYGLRACWSEPVFSPDGRVVGTFAMYYHQPRAPTEAELRTIEMGAHLVGVAIEHNRAEEALRESEAKFRGIIEYANIGIAIVQDARFRFVNQHYASMMGYSVEELLGTEFMRYCTPDERERIVSFYTRRARGELVPPRYETAMVHKSGRHVYADVSAGIIPYGGRQATFVFLRDITEQKQAEQALEEAFQTLEQRVEERTKELAALNMVSAVLSRSLDLDEIMGSALDKTMEVTQMEMGATYLAEADGDPEGPSRKLVAYKLAAYRGLSEELARAIERIPLRNSAMEQAAELGRPYVWSVADVPPQVGLAEVFEREGLGFAISIPLTAKGQIVGSMNVGTRQFKAVTSETLSLLAAIGQQVGMAVENARLYAAEQDRREEAERRRRVAEGLREILAILNSRQTLSDMLDLIAGHACQVLGSDAAALLRLDKATGLMGIQAACNLDPEYATQISMPLGAGTAGRALAERRPVVIWDTAEAAVYLEAGGSDRPEVVADLLEQLAGQFRALFSVPVIVKDEAHGAITFYYCEPHSFSEEEFHLALSVADQVALAIENARLREQAGQAAAMEERGRLARELHDSVTQSLYSVTMYAEAAARLMAVGQETAAAEYLRDAGDTAQAALREMRLMIYQLRPPVLEKGGLAVALQVRLDAVERRGGIRAELMVEGQDRLPPAVQGELHQIAQEALNNALKHARAREVWVRLRFDEAATRLEVQDDGVGFEPATAKEGGGLGLPGMEERVLKIGGRLRIESAPGQGTRVVVHVPTGGGK